MTETKFNTVKDMLSLLASNLESTNQHLRIHAATLQGARTRGSKTKLPFYTCIHPDKNVNDIWERPLTEITDHPAIAPGCRLFRASIPEIEGRVECFPYRTVMDAGAVVKVRDGEHGPELYTVDYKANSYFTDGIYFIVGSYGDEVALYTWHPGEPLARLSDGVNDLTGVKVDTPKS